ncbi:helix-turn-helix transcriptional regulator [uncultured Alteromonas sp.]|jgi:DNA-binding XRE family transcriptional regulator|uniref:helix-turn-helix transcriptional regulator n=1 Tax=uncultured Alteromonas sp. TaxID=179113 RepID=UPI0025CF56D6|nr:helix-turn-helix transcriptional regulator [uncultured Alteromonas sp.]
MKDIPLLFDGRRLKELRLRAGFTQQDIAYRIKITRESVSAIERNRPSAIRGLRWSVIHQWCYNCKDRVSHEHLTEFTKYLIGLLDEN